MTRALRLPALLAILVGALVLACGSGGAGTSTAAATSAGAGDGGPIRVMLNEWALRPVPASAPAGSVTFDVRNEGLLPHDFVVVRSDLAPDQLPTSAGLVDEGKVTLVGRSVPLTPGASEKVTLDLAAGRYVLICNIVGHYNLGQHAAFTAR